jgi:lincosamide nucleotidyltransferase A/C/D/E
MEMPSDEVLAIHDLMADNGVELWIDGGWGVDALLGRQTRAHGDLDVTLQKKDEQTFHELLGRRGYQEKGETYARPFNYGLVDDAGHEIDLHLIELDEHGNGIYGDDQGESFTAHSLGGRGTIDGREVRCIAAEDVVRFHSGYELTEKDFHDVSALCEAFGMDLPGEYRSFLDGHVRD